MLDKLRKAVAPSSLETELADIEAKLPGLDVEREEHRLAAGQLVSMMSLGRTGSGEDGLHRKHWTRIHEIDEVTSGLRARRRELIKLMKPEPEARQALVQVPMSKDLLAVVSDLEVARTKRQKLIEDGWDETSDEKARKRAAKLADIEREIADLRVVRQQLLIPYYEELMVALEPYLRTSARKLKAAADMFLEALTEMQEIGGMVPFRMGGHGNGFDPVVRINAQPTMEAARVAESILARMPPDPEELARVLETPSESEEVSAVAAE